MINTMNFNYFLNKKGKKMKKLLSSALLVAAVSFTVYNVFTKKMDNPLIALNQCNVVLQNDGTSEKSCQKSSIVNVVKSASESSGKVSVDFSVAGHKIF